MSSAIRCPNCAALMNEYESCPECPHVDDYDCECPACTHYYSEPISDGGEGCGFLTIAFIVSFVAMMVYLAVGFLSSGR